MENSKTVLVYTTFPSAGEAAAAGRCLVERRLAACVNIIPGMKSVYRWQGAIEEADEVVMLVKTRDTLAAAVTAAVKSIHVYDNPAILVVPVTGGSTDFLGWIVSETAPAA